MIQYRIQYWSPADEIVRFYYAVMLFENLYSTTSNLAGSASSVRHDGIGRDESSPSVIHQAVNRQNETRNKY